MSLWTVVYVYECSNSLRMSPVNDVFNGLYMKKWRNCSGVLVSKDAVAP